jgi:hypothetical protein
MACAAPAIAMAIDPAREVRSPFIVLFSILKKVVPTRSSAVIDARLLGFEAEGFARGFNASEVNPILEPINIADFPSFLGRLAVFKREGQQCFLQASNFCIPTLQATFEFAFTSGHHNP